MFSLFSPPTAKKNVTQKRKNLKKQRAEKQSKNDERPLQAVLNQGYELMERHGLFIPKQASLARWLYLHLRPN